MIFCATGWCSCRGEDSRTVRKKGGKRERKSAEREREVVLSSIYTSSRSRLRETSAFPSRPGIDAEERKRERERTRERGKDARVSEALRPLTTALLITICFPFAR